MSKFLNINQNQINSFISKINFPKIDDKIDYSKCWIFTGFLDKDGYGRFLSISAHRFAYFITYNIDPTGHIIRHNCDNPSCVNPHHLLIGTVQDNVNDKIMRGRQVYGDMRSSNKLNKIQLFQLLIDIIELKYNTFQELANQYNVCKSTIRHILQGKLWKRDTLDFIKSKNLSLLDLESRFISHCKKEFLINNQTKFGYDEIKLLFEDILNYTHRSELIRKYECSGQSLIDIVKGKFKSEMSNIICYELQTDLSHIEFLYYHGINYKYINSLFNDVLTGNFSTRDLSIKYNKDMSAINKALNQKSYKYESDLYLIENNLTINDILKMI